MLSYDELVTGLEDAWSAAGLHEHAILETVRPDTHERLYRTELFPEHDDYLNEDNTPPWVEISFTWAATHQLRSEGRDAEEEALDISWTYMVLVHSSMRERSDRELVQMFQRAVQRALRRMFPTENENPISVPVEVRRIYRNEGAGPQVMHVQLVSTNVTDFSDHWDESDPRTLQHSLRVEVQLASAIVHALSDTFSASGQGNYRPVETA